MNRNFLVFATIVFVSFTHNFSFGHDWQRDNKRSILDLDEHDFLNMLKGSDFSRLDDDDIQEQDLPVDSSDNENESAATPNITEQISVLRKNLPVDESLQPRLPISNLETDLVVNRQKMHLSRAMLNDDGTVTFSYPRYMGAFINMNNTDGRHLGTDEICHFFFPDKKLDVHHLAGAGTGIQEVTSILGYQPRFVTFRSSKNFQLSMEKIRYTKPKNIVSSVTCAFSEGLPISSNYKKRNIYQTNKLFTVYTRPQFKFRGIRYALSVYSDNEAICRLYGNKHFVSRSTKKRRFKKRAIRLGKDGRREETLDTNETIQEITCRDD